MEPDRFLAELYERLHMLMLVYAKAHLGELSPLAEDAVQESFCIAAAKQSDVLHSKNPEGYLMLVLKNVIRNMKRHQRHISRLFISTSALAAPAAASAKLELSPDVLYEDLIQNRDYQLICQLIQHGFSITALADRLGISYGACRKRVARARASLKKYFTE